MRLLDLAKLSFALGPHRVARNVVHRARLRTGAYRRSTPLHPLAMLSDAVAASVRNPFALKGPITLTAAASRELRERGQRIAAGELEYFSHHWLARPPWRTHPATGYRTADRHWTETSEFVPGQGDVKWIWEASRFDWVYTLARAWRANGDERAVDTFWSLLEDWIADNPPNFGINWRCAQECSLRLIALVWAAAAFEGAPVSTPPRVRALWSLVSALAERVQVSTGYALSQNNNHGLSEACALYLAGTCLPSHESSSQWRRHGRQLFEQQVLEQFAPDGFYVQNSFNYTRLALRTCMVFLLTAVALREPVAANVRERIGAAVGLLRAAIDPVSGRVPNFGANDGANVMSLSACEYLDFRPVAQSTWFLLTGRKLFEGALDADEELRWLGVADTEALATEPAPASGHSALSSGYFVLASGDSRLQIRCGTHRSRPGHADMLHADIWHPGINLARDAGTYGYNDENNWSTVLAGTAAHNTIVVDGQDQMRKVSRFLWADWTRAQVIKARLDPSRPEFSGVHFGYRRLGVDHRRTIHGRDGDWLVLDDLLFDAPGSHELALFWHLDAGLGWSREERGARAAASDYRLSVGTAVDATYEWLDRAGDLPRNGDSLYYGSITAGAVFVLRARASASTRFISAIGRARLQIADGTAAWHDLVVPMSPA